MWRLWPLLPGLAACAVGIDFAWPLDGRSKPLGMALLGAGLVVLGLCAVGGGLAWTWTHLLASGRLAPWHKRAALAALSATVGLMVAVVVAASVRDVRQLDVALDGEIGWVPNPDPPEKVGQRGDVVDPSREHLLLVGDSILYGRGVGAGDTIPAQLAKRVTRYQVLNAGVEGYSLDQDYLYLKRILPRVKPKVVVIGVFAGNDWQVTSRDYTWGHSKPLFEVRDGKLVHTNPDRTGACSDQLASSLLFRLFWRQGPEAEQLLYLFCRPRVLAPWEADATIAALNAAMLADARAAGAKVVFLLLPDAGDHPERDDEHFVKFVSRHLRLASLVPPDADAFIDGWELVVRSGRPVHELFIDTGHYGPEGGRVVAEALHAALEAKLGLEL